MNQCRSLLPPPNGTWELIRQMIYEQVNHRPWCEEKGQGPQAFLSSNPLYPRPQFPGLVHPSPVPSPLTQTPPAINCLWRTTTFSDKNGQVELVVFSSLHQLFLRKLELDIWSYSPTSCPYTYPLPTLRQKTRLIFTFKIIIIIVIIFRIIVMIITIMY